MRLQTRAASFLAVSGALVPPLACPLVYGQCETATLVHPDDPPKDLFGNVALSGNLAVVTDTLAADGTGAAFVFERRGTEWSPSATLTSPEPDVRDSFGIAVAIERDIIAVGAPGRNDLEGVVYVYRMNDEKWRFEQALTADDTDKLDRFGFSIAIHEGVLLIGARTEENDGLPASGAAYVFRYGDGAWRQTAKLVDPRRREGDRLGDAVALYRGVAVVGAPGADGFRGKALVFRADGDSWKREADLMPETLRGTLFGDSVAVADGTVAVGAPGLLGTTGGAAFAFRFDGESWRETQRLLTERGVGFDFFGTTVELSRPSGSTLVVGAAFDNEGGGDAGAAYLYRRTNDTWNEAEKLIGRRAGEQFAITMSIHEDMLACGGFAGDGIVYLFAGMQAVDCNGNMTPDGCDIVRGTSADVDANGVPDECEQIGDLDRDGDVDHNDLLVLLRAWGKCPQPCPPCAADLDGDCEVKSADLLRLLANWG